MTNNNDWQQELRNIVDEFGGEHATKGKCVSKKTRRERERALFRIFALLRELGFRTKPSNLGERHVVALMKYWTCHPDAANMPYGSTHKIAQLSAPLSPGYIQQLLSLLRTFCAWIDKPGMIRAAHCYVSDPSLVQRSYGPARDKGWGENGPSREQILADVDRRCYHVGVQLRMYDAFGLTIKEAVMFRPHIAVVPAYALPANLGADTEYLAFLKIKRGTTGIRVRYTAASDERQIEALAMARKTASYSHAHMGKPGLNLSQSVDHFNYVTRAAGLIRDGLVLTPHGLRPDLTGDLFFDIAKLAIRARRGDPTIDPDAMRAAYQEVARQLVNGGLPYRARARARP